MLDPDALLDTLVARLDSVLGVPTVATFDDLLNADRAAALRRPALRVAEQFDVDPELLVVEPVLGVLGLVDVAPEIDANFEEAVDRMVDRAAFVSHLCHTHSTARTLRPWTVELVVIARDEQEQPLGGLLRKLARETSYLYEIGINVLTCAPDDSDAERAIDERQLRRAFSWLLVATRAWFADAHAGLAGRPRARSRRLQRLALHNFRLPGVRELKLSSEDGMQVVFGHNGSGKSSIVEALEYVLCRQIERLAEISDNADFERTVRNEDAPPNTARIELDCGPRKRFSCTATQCTNPKDFDRRIVNRASFILDQLVMDRLTRSSSAERTQHFYSAFFAGEEVAALKEHNERAREAGKLWNKVPKDLRKAVISQPTKAPSPEQVLAGLSWLGSKRATPDPAQLAECLPVNPETLRDLGKVHPDVAAAAELWGTAPANLGAAKKALAAIDAALEGPRAAAEESVAQLQQACDVLKSLADWHVPPTPQPLRLVIVDLNAWLRCTALADLADVHLDLASGLAHVAATGTPIGWPDPVGLFAHNLSDDEFERLRQQRDAWRAAANQHRGNLPQERERESAGANQADPHPPQYPADLLALRVLDQISPFAASLYAADDDIGLGKCVADAFASQREQPFGSLRVGEPAWATHLRERLDPVLRAYKRLTRTLRSTGTERLRMLQDAFDSYTELKRSGDELESSFLHMIGAGSAETESDARGASPDASNDPTPSTAAPPATRTAVSTGPVPGSVRRLYNALNELLALFTPARWAYDDIAVTLQRPGSDSGRTESVGFVTQPNEAASAGSVRADLRFNSAQLNTLALSLFLLAARRVDNPLRLLVLDDPLQNMDELTVVFVARGFARLMQIWSPPAESKGRRRATSRADDAWQILLLLHGEENLARFRRELPTTIHWLPFQTPSADDARQHIAIPIERLKAGQQTELQQLRQLLQAR